MFYRQLFRNPGVKSLFALILSLLLVPVYGQNSLLAEGEWVRFSIPENGMYRLRGSDLQAAGLSINGIPSEQIHVAAFPGGPLPQELGEGAPPGLRELAILVLDGNDGVFNPADVIVFYAEGPDKIHGSPDGASFEYNPYSRQNYVFVGISPAESKRTTVLGAMSAAGPGITSFRDAAFYKDSENNLLRSGRKWYGQRLQSGQSASVAFDLPDLVPGSNVTLTSAVMAQSFSPATFTLTWGGGIIGEQNVDAVPDFLNPPSNNPYRFSTKGREVISSFSFPAGTGNGQPLVTIGYSGSGGGRSIGYPDYLLVEAERSLILRGPSLVFSGSGPGIYSLQFSGTAPLIWDISDFYNAQSIVSESTAGQTTFSESRNDIRRYAAFVPAGLPIPEADGPVTEQNLPGAPSADLLIVTHPDFLEAANTLAAHRRSFSQRNVVVATTEMIYNEYSGGRQDVSAIRNFARELYLKGSLEHVLLLGKGTFDYLGILSVNVNFVPTYQSRNSLEPLDSYASDDFFGFLETGEGSWEEVAGGNHTLDAGVGRLAVTTPEEANQLVAKIIRYDLDRNTLGAWRSRLVFVADDEDFNLHHRQAERLATFSDTTYIPFRNQKIYLGAFPQESGAGGQTIPEARDAIDRSVREGALVVNYTGHGGESGWAQEQVLTRQMIREWNNRDRLPLFVTATCEFGRHDNPNEASGGELVVNMPNGGGIALLSTGRPVFSSSNFSVNRAFYENVFDFQDGKPPAFGDIFRKTKNESIDDAIDINRVGNRNFTLLGDPSQRLAYPRAMVRLSGLTADGQSTDTLKAGSTIIMETEVLNSTGSRDLSFDGTADILVTDKPVDRQTIDQPVFNYQTRENILFRGKATVSQGRAVFTFVVPRNISQKSGNGRIQLYARHEQGDAIGGSDSVFVGGTSAIPPADDTGPDISVFFGDSTNTSRTDVNDNTLLFVRLEDESGINISGFGVGNSLTASLDGKEYALNEYYTADRDNYQAGWAVFPLSDMEKGPHVLTIKAWDVYNNSNELVVNFSVADPGTLVLKNVMNYPQPVETETTFRFDHNRAGETLEVEWTLLGSRGQYIEKRAFLIEDSPSRVELTSWGPERTDKNLVPGIYFYSIVVRSTLDGATAKKYQKLIFID